MVTKPKGKQQMWDWLEDAWDGFLDGFDSFIHFEWAEGMLDGFREFSVYGIIFAVIGVAVSWITRFINVNDFAKGGIIETMTMHMPPGQRILWTIASYAAVAIAGYILGSHFENS